MNLSPIERARRYIAKCPAAISGQGGHNATFRVAALLVDRFRLSTGDATVLMREWNRSCQPRWSERELQHKVESAVQHLSSTDRGCRRRLGECPARQCNSHDRSRIRSGIAARDPQNEVEFFLNGFRCTPQDLAGASPVRMEGNWRFDGAVLVRALYQPGEQINFVTEFEERREANGEIKARPKGHGLTLERDALVARFLEGRHTDASDAGGWLRMNPTDGMGIGDANVAAFRFALLESDTLPAELQLSLFARLPLPVAAILSSGARSYHAWVCIDAADADEYRCIVARLHELVGKFGMDGKNKNPSRLSRLPGAKRNIGAVGDGVQRLLYLNPQPEQRRILN